jgi:hypothetical protein
MDSRLRPIYRKVLKPFYKTTLEGAQTQIRLAVDPELERVSGKYFCDCEEKIPSEAAQDYETAAWLWNKSTQLIYDKLKELDKSSEN